MTDPAASTTAATAPAVGVPVPALTAAHGRRRSLAWRLGLLLGVSVVVVPVLSPGRGFVPTRMSLISPR